MSIKRKIIKNVEKHTRGIFLVKCTSVIYFSSLFLFALMLLSTFYISSEKKTKCITANRNWCIGHMKVYCTTKAFCIRYLRRENFSYGSYYVSLLLFFAFFLRWILLDIPYGLLFGFVCFFSLFWDVFWCICCFVVVVRCLFWFHMRLICSFHFQKFNKAHKC